MTTAELRARVLRELRDTVESESTLRERVGEVVMELLDLETEGVDFASNGCSCCPPYPYTFKLVGTEHPFASPPR